MPQSALDRSQVSSGCGNDRPMGVPEHVEADRIEPGPFARRVENTRTVVDFLDSHAIRRREDESLPRRPPSPEPMGLEVAGKLPGDRDVAGASLGLRGLFAVDGSVTSPDVDPGIVVQLKVAPPQRLQLGHASARFREESREQPVFRCRHRGQKPHEFLDAQVSRFVGSGFAGIAPSSVAALNITDRGAKIRRRVDPGPAIDARLVLPPQVACSRRILRASSAPIGLGRSSGGCTSG